jgi:hypothetical protein
MRIVRGDPQNGHGRVEDSGDAPQRLEHDKHSIGYRTTRLRFIAPS